MIKKELEKTSHERGKYAECLCRAYLAGCGRKVQDVSDNEDFQHDDIDLLAESKEGQMDTTIEVKNDSVSWETGNIPWECTCQMSETAAQTIAAELNARPYDMKKGWHGTCTYQKAMELFKKLGKWAPIGCFEKTKAQFLFYVSTEEKYKYSNIFRLCKPDEKNNIYPFCLMDMNKFREYIANINRPLRYSIKHHDNENVYNFLFLLPFKDIPKDIFNAPSEESLNRFKELPIFQEYHSIEEIENLLGEL